MRAEIWSPGRTGLSQRISSMPGEPMELESSSIPSASNRIMIMQVCQPEAESPPSMLWRAASSSRCIGCGSYSDAKAMISSRVTVFGPCVSPWPSAKSSK